MESRYLGFADRRLLVEYPPAFERIINFLFVNVPSGMDQKPDHTFTVVPQQSGTCTLLKDKEKIGDTADDTTMANLLMGEIIYAMIDGVHSGLTLHAAAVAWKNKGIWMPGTSGAGKSSLSAWFVSHGYTYLTDELIHCP
ncbi:MAG TPA: hypothetical protein ENK89_02500, partial [Desulfobulbaceae bacterium]|nr:hypothetical protein [Desulfobulbaceae bacterium]